MALVTTGYAASASFTGCPMRFTFRDLSSRQMPLLDWYISPLGVSTTLRESMQPRSVARDVDVPILAALAGVVGAVAT